MIFEWDEAKRRMNLEKHGVDFSMAPNLEWHSAIPLPERDEYGEARVAVIGIIEDRLHVCVYTMRGANRRIISLRKANKREEKLYDEESAALD